MSQGRVIDIMTYNSYGLQYYSFRKGKIGFARTVPVFLDHANSHQTLQYNNITVSKNDFFVLQALQLTVDSFGKWIFLVAYGKKSLEEIFNKNMAYGQKYIIGI